MQAEDLWKERGCVSKRKRHFKILTSGTVWSGIVRVGWLEIGVGHSIRCITAISGPRVPQPPFVPCRPRVRSPCGPESWPSKAAVSAVHHVRHHVLNITAPFWKWHLKCWTHGYYWQIFIADLVFDTSKESLCLYHPNNLFPMELKQLVGLWVNNRVPILVA